MNGKTICFQLKVKVFSYQQGLICARILLCSHVLSTYMSRVSRKKGRVCLQQ